MEWQHERRLVFTVGEKWSGWFCERCCWSRSLPNSPAERQRLAHLIQDEYRAHDCGTFAREHWAAGGSSS